MFQINVKLGCLVYVLQTLPYWDWTQYYSSRCVIKNPFYHTQSEAELSEEDCKVWHCVTVHSVWLTTLIISQCFVCYHFLAKHYDCGLHDNWPCPPIDSTMRLMTVWRKTGKIIRTAIFDTYAQLLTAVLTILGFRRFLCFVFHKG